MKSILFSIVGLFIIISCQSQTEGVPSAIEGYINYGATVNNVDDVLSVEEAITKVVADEEVKVKVTGVVESVCKKKGCWMNVNSEDASASLFVRFEDYGFFMPKDCEGSEVIMEGVVFKEVTSVDELKHYAEDEGKSKEEIEAITESEEKFKFTATGVLMKSS